MSFLSFRYVLFFLVIYLINWIYVGGCRCLKQKSYKKYSTLLLVESYAFIIISDWKTAICLFLQTIIVYFVSKGMNKYRNNRRLFLTIFTCGIVFSIGQLITYKYCDFLVQSIGEILGFTYETKIVHFVPLGISFFTFSAVGYLIDLYRKKYCVFEKLDELALYLAFFPKFISGPIVRADKFIQQTKSGFCSVSLQNLQIGIQYVVWGMFKKMVMADHLAVFVDEVFKVPTAFNSATCLWAIISYSLQIYFDFAGYSDMAIGFSKMLGINIDKNFDLPYISYNITEFWKRWHISLSSWLQDYLYISLGGNRKGKIRRYFNLIITMLIGGLWHGASWNFVMWGGIHGIALVIHKEFMKLRNKYLIHPEQGKTKKKIWSIVVTYIFVCITWVFFRAETFSQAISLLVQSVTIREGIQQIYSWTFLAIAFAICEIIYSVIRCNKKAEKRVEISYPILNLNTIGGLFLFFVLTGLTIILAYVGQVAFIYGKF